MEPTPEILYKYVPPDLLRKVLADARIRFSPLADLNDVFEGRPRVTVDRPSVERRLASEGYRGEEQQRRADGFVRYAEREGTDILYKMTNREYGFLCLSANPLHHAMWGQYAGSYRGFVVGFRSVHRFISPNPDRDDISDRPLPVEYLGERPTVKIAALDDPSLHDQFRRGAVLTKSTDWEFEREYRLARDVREADEPREGEVSNLFGFPEDVVAEVILGSRFSGENRGVIAALIAEGRYPQTEFFDLVVPADSYQLARGPFVL